MFAVVNSTTFSSNTTRPTTNNGVSNHLPSTNNPDSNPDQGATSATNMGQRLGSAFERNKNQGATQMASSTISTEKPVTSRTESGEGGSSTTKSLVSNNTKDNQGNWRVWIIL